MEVNLRALNLGIEKYGFPVKTIFNVPTFNGHQKCLAFCILDEQGNIEDTMLPNGSNKELSEAKVKEILADNSIMKIIEDTQSVDSKGNLAKKEIYYLPYYVENHTAYQPTINFDNIEQETGKEFLATIEILLVYSNLNRYTTISFSTKNASVLDTVDNIFKSEPERRNAMLQELGFKYEDDCWFIDMYNETGELFNINFPSIKDIRDAIVSVRLIALGENIIDK